jgi:hypothetical protein
MENRRDVAVRTKNVLVDEIDGLRFSSGKNRLA